MAWCRPAWLVWLLLMLSLALPAAAQDGRDAQRKLERIKRELREVASDRRKIEGERGKATRELRAADEQVGKSVRSLRDIEVSIARQRTALAELTARRDRLRATLGAQRLELATLLREAYTLGGDAGLKLALSQDTVAERNRNLAYHGYLQRQRSARIAALNVELAGLQAAERQIARERVALDRARAELDDRVATLERDRKARAESVAGLDQRFKDRSDRERTLGRDAKALERVLAQLRATAARAAAERKAAQRKAAATATTPAESRGTPVPRAPRVDVARTAPVKVGGLGWPLSGTLVAGFGGRMPDGRSSSGVLIGAPAGTSVGAVADGTVVFAEWMTGYGLILIVDHGNGYMSLYAHNDALLRDQGDRVTRGDAVASVGNSGGQGRPALYFELRRNGQPVDPGGWLQRR